MTLLAHNLVSSMTPCPCHAAVRQPRHSVQLNCVALGFRHPVSTQVPAEEQQQMDVESL